MGKAPTALDRGGNVARNVYTDIAPEVARWGLPLVGRREDVPRTRPAFNPVDFLAGSTRVYNTGPWLQSVRRRMAGVRPLELRRGAL